MQRPTLRGIDRHDAERGASTLGILLVVVILGVLVAITLKFGFGATSPSTTIAGSHATTTTAPSTPAQGATAAMLSACEANYATIQQAVATYQALNGAKPPSGSAWSTATANGGPILQAWPTSPGHYSITWNGSVISVVPVHGTASHGSYGVSSPPSGCFAQ